MGESIYRKYGAVLDPSGMQAGLTAQKGNLKDILAGVTDLMNIQEKGYVQQNTLNVQEYLKNKMQGEGLNAALTTPVNQEEIKQRFGNMIDMNAVNSTVSSQTDLLKKNTIEAVETEANTILKETNDPVQAANALTEGLRKRGATQSFVDEQLPLYVTRKATEIQNINTAEAQAHETSIGTILDIAARTGKDKDGKDLGGQNAALIAIEGEVAKLRPEKRRAAREKYTAALANAGKPDEFDSALIKDYTDGAKITAQRNITAAKNVAIEIDLNLKAAQNAGVQDKFYALADEKTSLVDKDDNTTSSITAKLGSRLNNWFVRAWGGNSIDSAKLRQIRQDLSTKHGMGSRDADAILIQAFEETYTGDGAIYNNLNDSELTDIANKTKTLADNRKVIVALQADSVKAQKAVADVEAKNTQDVIDLGTRLREAGRDQRLRRGLNVPGDPNGAKTIKEEAEKFRAALGQRDLTTSTSLTGANTEPAKAVDVNALTYKYAGVDPVTGKDVVAAPAAAPVTPTTNQPTPVSKRVTQEEKVKLQGQIKSSVQKAVLKLPEVPARYLMVAAMIESRNNANAVNPNSGAKGAWQFVGGTAEAYALTGKEQNTDEAAVAAGRYYLDNRKEIGKVPDHDMYLAHQQGATGYKKLINAATNNVSMDAVPADVKARILANTPDSMKAGITPASFVAYWRQTYKDVEASMYNTTADKSSKPTTKKAATAKFKAALPRN